MEILLILISCIIFLIATVTCRTLVLYKFWGWFIIPAFGVEPISFLLAMGITFLISFFTFDHKDAVEPDQNYWNALNRGVTINIITPLLILLFGWIITLFL